MSQPWIDVMKDACIPLVHPAATTIKNIFIKNCFGCLTSNADIKIEGASPAIKESLWISQEKQRL